MPQMTGLEAMKRILDIDPCARFIVLSADEVVRDEAMETGARAFVKKPASLAEICRTLERVLSQH